MHHQGRQEASTTHPGFLSFYFVLSQSVSFRFVILCVFPYFFLSPSINIFLSLSHTLCLSMSLPISLYTSLSSLVLVFAHNFPFFTHSWSLTFSSKGGPDILSLLNPSVFQEAFPPPTSAFAPNTFSRHDASSWRGAYPWNWDVENFACCWACRKNCVVLSSHQFKPGARNSSQTPVSCY